MNTNVNAAQVRRLEEARRNNGQFGSHPPRPEAELDLSDLVCDNGPLSGGSSAGYNDDDGRGYTGGARIPSDPVCRTRDDGTKEWTRGSHLHRDRDPAVEHPDGRKEWWVDGRQTLGDALDRDNKFDPRIDREGHMWVWNDTAEKWRLRGSVVGVVESPGLNNIDHLHGPLRLPFVDERMPRRFRRPTTEATQ